MPTAILRDAFVRDLSWDKALREARRQSQSKRSGGSSPAKPPVQISFFDRLERGLALVMTIGVSGLRTFSVMVYRNGKPRMRKLGAYPAMSLKDAREKAREYWVNPEKAEAQTAAGSFKEVSENWLSKHVQARRLRSENEIRRMLTKYIYPRLGNAKFVEVRRGQVADLLDEVAANHGAAQADACLAIVRGVMNWYQARNEHYLSPIVRGMRRYESKPRERILTDEEIRAIWASADGIFGSIVKLALLTAQRKAKLNSLRWGDLVGDEWIISTEPREKGNPGRLRLPAAALQVLHDLPRIAGNSFVFPGHAGGPFSRWSEAKRDLDQRLESAGYKLGRWTVHDLRRTARSLMSRAAILPHISEQVLGHAQPGIVGVYDRHGYDAEKSDALKKLAALISSIVDPQENVVFLARG